MKKVVGVRFKHANKTYYFDPNGIDVEIGDKVVVETARGMELGTVIFKDKELSKKHDMDVKPILRMANERDLANQNRSKSEKAEAMRLCKEKIKSHDLDMKLVDVEYTLDNSKIIFYFTSDGRVDFRELVKDLAAIFRIRIELRQIGVRDEAKMIGNDKAVRAVGSANGKNCIPIIIPCHRIVYKGGEIGGYSGGEGGNKGIEIKKYLLELEKNFK